MFPFNFVSLFNDYYYGNKENEILKEISDIYASLSSHFVPCINGSQLSFIENNEIFVKSEKFCQNIINTPEKFENLIKDGKINFPLKIYNSNGFDKWIDFISHYILYHTTFKISFNYFGKILSVGKFKKMVNNFKKSNLQLKLNGNYIYGTFRVYANNINNFYIKNTIEEIINKKILIIFNKKGNKTFGYFNIKINKNKITTVLIEELYKLITTEILQKTGFLISSIKLDQSIMTIRKLKKFNFNEVKYTVGYEVETGLPELHCSLALNYLQKEGNVVSTTYDGGGLEIRTVALRNPNMFSVIGRFDSLLKQIRSKTNYKLNRGAGTHVHLKINYNNLLKDSHQRYLINNIYALFYKYDFGLFFFDTFLPTGRRLSHWGFPFALNKVDNKSIMFCRDSRYTKPYLNKIPNYNGVTSEVTGKLGRCSVLRYITTNSNNTHWEWRGTDVCPSALFLGLKTELLLAILKKALDISVKGITLEPEDQEVSKRLKRLVPKDCNIFSLSDIVARKEAERIVTDLKEYISPLAYRGLKAWCKYVDILRKDTGTKLWFEEMEKILIHSIGIKYFLTTKELEKLFELKEENYTYYPKMIKKLTKEEQEKQTLYELIIPSKANNCRLGQGRASPIDPNRIANNVSCQNCGITTSKLEMLRGRAICNKCYTELKFVPMHISRKRRKSPRTNLKIETLSLVESLVRATLGENHE